MTMMATILVIAWPMLYMGVGVSDADIPGHSRRGPKGYNQRAKKADVQSFIFRFESYNRPNLTNTGRAIPDAEQHGA